MQTQGIQIWTIPVSGLYEIIAAGAGIGHVSRGRGAIVSTVHTLAAGQRIKILVGQSPTGTASGAGGTFVATDTDVPILVAGGGGGGFNLFPTQNGGTQDGVLTTSGSAARSGAGGTNGGAGANSNEGAVVTGGAGFTANVSLTWVNGWIYRAFSFIHGGVGGYRVTFNDDLKGGFGGGGYTNFSGAGGGGYSGGAAGASQGFPNSETGGGGGGSYDINGVNNNATRYTDTIVVNGVTYSNGFNFGNGFVRCTYLGEPVVEPPFNIADYTINEYPPAAFPSGTTGLVNTATINGQEYTASASSSVDPYYPRLAFNKLTTTFNDFWISRGYTMSVGTPDPSSPFTNTTRGEWIQLQLPVPIKLTSYIIYKDSNQNSRPIDWTIFGSVDGTTWVSVNAQTSQTTLEQTYTLNVTDARNKYTYYRLVVQLVTTQFAISSGAWIREWRLFGFE